MHLRYKLAAAAGLYCMLITQLIAAETLTIVVTNVSASDGNLMIQVMSGEEEFKGEQASIASVMQRAQQGEMSFTTTSLPPGEYAIRVMHDSNGNGDLDSNFVGMPKEPWAMSNNAKGNFGPPAWKDVKFTLEGSVTQTLELSK